MGEDGGIRTEWGLAIGEIAEGAMNAFGFGPEVMTLAEPDGYFCEMEPADFELAHDFPRVFRIVYLMLFSKIVLASLLALSHCSCRRKRKGDQHGIQELGERGRTVPSVGVHHRELWGGWHAQCDECGMGWRVQSP